MLKTLFSRGSKVKRITQNALYRSSDFERVVPLAQYAKEAGDGMADDFSIDLRRVVASFGFRRLQNKTQLFPVGWNDFVRNRLTHSLDVAQVAKEITFAINETNPFFAENPLDPDLIQLAALCHDIGHPPFGHSGETALHNCMRDSGGFEGNAQTLRLIARLERREDPRSSNAGQEPLLPRDPANRCGLNLTMRSIAAVVKYDREIPHIVSGAELTKGYYREERPVVDACRRKVLHSSSAKFPTVECSIMDMSDDIAYATYDLEDAFRVGILTPLGMLSPGSRLLELVADRASVATKSRVSVRDVETAMRGAVRMLTAAATNSGGDRLEAATSVFRTSSEIALMPQHRVEFVETLQSYFKHAVRLLFNAKAPQLSSVYMEGEALLLMEVLKSFNYHAVIRSTDIQRAAHKADVIIRGLFEAFRGKGGLDLIPELRRVLFEGQSGAALDRHICDFIADMTDLYASEIFARLKSVYPERVYHVL